MRKLVVALAVLMVAGPAVALGGGWATVKLSSTPTDMRAGAPWVVELTVLQHGVTPLAGVRPEVRIAQGSITRSFPARPTASINFSTRSAFEDYASHLRPAVPGVEGVSDVVSDAAGGTAAAIARVFDRIQP